LLALEETEQARQVLREARSVAEETGARRFLWQILADLAEIEALLGNVSEVESMRGRTREIVAYIAEHTGSANLPASFLALPEVRAVLNSS
jgi:hypothetical protein